MNEQQVKQLTELIGKTVTWESSSSGSTTTKTGKVLAFVPPLEDIRKFFPSEYTGNQIKISQNTSERHRLLIEVPRSHKVTGESLSSWYYAPLASRFLEKKS